MTLEAVAAHLNTLADFLALRDLASPTPEALHAAAGVRRADLLILFGGSIVHGCDVAARAFQGGMAERMMLVGGEGHTTESLRQALALACPGLRTAGRPEADIIADDLRLTYGLEGMILENQSTHCGNNLSNALALARRLNLPRRHVLMMQDSSMQRRMDATARKVWAEESTRFLSYAAYRAEILAGPDGLAFAPNGIRGLWPLDRFIRLIMGEIPRLRDDANGYGPMGKGFLAHVEIPEPVEQAYQALLSEHPEWTRPAMAQKNP